MAHMELRFNIFLMSLTQKCPMGLKSNRPCVLQLDEVTARWPAIYLIEALGIPRPPQRIQKIEPPNNPLVSSR